MLSLGRRGEEVAGRLLVIERFKIVNRNYTCPLGEIDIIATQGDTLYFIEVKTRTSLAYGTPASAVISKKQNQLKRLAKYYMMVNCYSGDAQFGVVEVVYNIYAHRYSANLIRDAF